MAKAVRPPPQRTKEEDIDKIVNKGGKVAEESIKEEKFEKEKWTMITVRMPENLLKEIDSAIEKRIGLSRNAWILEAFQEKLKE